MLLETPLPHNRPRTMLNCNVIGWWNFEGVYNQGYCRTSASWLISWIRLQIQWSECRQGSSTVSVSDKLPVKFQPERSPPFGKLRATVKWTESLRIMNVHSAKLRFLRSVGRLTQSPRLSLQQSHKYVHAPKVLQGIVRHTDTCGFFSVTLWVNRLHQNRLQWGLRHLLNLKVLKWLSIHKSSTQYNYYVGKSCIKRVIQRESPRAMVLLGCLLLLSILTSAQTLTTMLACYNVDTGIWEASNSKDYERVHVKEWAMKELYQCSYVLEILTLANGSEWQEYCNWPGCKGIIHW